jgi:hypothetical protein
MAQVRYISGLFPLILYLAGCIFAPELREGEGSFIIKNQTSPMNVLSNFQNAYVFRDSLLYSDTLDSGFIFISKNYATTPPTDIIWGRDVDIRTTVRLFRHFNDLELTWGESWRDSLSYTIVDDSASIRVTFQLTLDSGRDIPTIKGEADFIFRRGAKGIWRIRRWDDLSTF